MLDKNTKKGITDELEGLFLKIDRGQSVGTMRKHANRLMGSITPGDIAAVEDKLMRGGLTSRRVQQLSASFILMGLMDSNQANLRDRLPYRHILKKVLAEHDMVMCFLADLEDLSAQIVQADFLNDTSCEVRRLAHIIDHIRSMEEHIQREEDVILPALRSQGWDSLCKSVESDHLVIGHAIFELCSLVDRFGKFAFGVFKTRLNTAVKNLCPILKEHIFHEDRILYPVVIAMIDKPEFWDKMRDICDEIDYCGIHL
jgi:DUF438 domain-containing protein